MAIIVNKKTKEVRYFGGDYVLEDKLAVFKDGKVDCVDASLNSDNAEIILEVKDIPEDITGNKYLYVNKGFVLNQEWVKSEKEKDERKKEKMKEKDERKKKMATSE